MDIEAKEKIQEIVDQSHRIAPRKGLAKDVTIGLLSVSKQVREEAMPLLYGVNIWSIRFSGDNGYTTCLRSIPEHGLKLIKHVYIEVNNQRAWEDPKLDDDSCRINHDLASLCNNLRSNTEKLKTLTVKYKTCYDGWVEEVRVLVDETADASHSPPTMPGAIMVTLQRQYGFAIKEFAKYSRLFKYQNCLDPLKILEDHVSELSLAGDMSQAYINEIVTAISPAVVTERKKPHHPVIQNLEL